MAIVDLPYDDPSSSSTRYVTISINLNQTYNKNDLHSIVIYPEFRSNDTSNNTLHVCHRRASELDIKVSFVESNQEKNVLYSWDGVQTPSAVSNLNKTKMVMQYLVKPATAGNVQLRDPGTTFNNVFIDSFNYPLNPFTIYEQTHAA